jgi:hypothetical protein
MKWKLMIASLLIIFFSCKKNNDDVSGKEEMNGKLYVENIYDGEQKKFLPNLPIFISNDIVATSNSFLFSKSSDKNGYFLFQYLYNKQYALHAEMRANTSQNTNILFTADSVLNPNKNLDLVLRPDTKTQNGLYIICIDSIIPSGRIPSANIYIYTSRVLAVNDTALLSGAGAAYSFTAKLDGTGFKMNLPTENLYINTVLNVAGGFRLKSKLNSITLDKNGIKTLTVVMKN